MNSAYSLQTTKVHKIFGIRAKSRASKTSFKKVFKFGGRFLGLPGQKVGRKEDKNLL
jgi:hypothetical protein